MKKILVSLMISVSLFGVSCGKAPVVEDQVVESSVESNTEDNTAKESHECTREEKIDNCVNELYETITRSFSDSECTIECERNGNIDVISIEIKTKGLLTDFSKMVETRNFTDYDLLVKDFERISLEFQEYVDEEIDDVLVLIDLTDLDTDFPFFGVSKGETYWNAKDEYLNK